MMAESSWERLIRLFCDNPKVIKDYPVYKWMVRDYGIPFMEKLVDTALNSPSIEARNHAAIVIQEMSETTDLLKNAYLDIHLQTLGLFRRSALHLMIFNEVGSDLQYCGFLLTVDLVRLSLQHNDIDGWPGFLVLVERGFSTHPRILSLILDVFCELPHHPHTAKFVNFLEPCIMRNAHQFIATLQNLLQQGDDLGVYVFLPSLYSLFSERIWKILMTGAIMSPFFQRETQPSRRIFAAEYLKISIEKTTFNFSSALIPHMRDILLVLFQSGDARETNAAFGLCAALLYSGVKAYLRERRSLTSGTCRRKRRRR